MVRRLLLLILLVGIVSSNRALQAQPLIDNTSISAAVDRLGLPNLFIQRSTFRGPVTSDQTFTLRFSLSERQSLQVSTGYARVASAPDAVRDDFPTKAIWKFKAVPLTVGYEYALMPPQGPLVPVVGVGATYYVTRMKMLNDPLEAAASKAGVVSTDLSPSFAKRYGMGYGAQATLGLHIRLTDQLYAITQSRFRYINGLALTSGGLGSEFMCLDFSIGLGVKL